VPVNAEDGGAYRLHDMFAHPPGRESKGGGERERGREGERKEREMKWRDKGRINDETMRQLVGSTLAYQSFSLSK